MKVYGNISMSEGSDIVNLTAPRGSSFPDNATAGEMFFHNALGMSFYDGVQWNQIQDGTNFSFTDGSRPFTGPVAGIDPVGNADLATWGSIEGLDLTITGDASGSCIFNNRTISLTLADAGVTAGTYNSVTVDTKGRVTDGATLPLDVIGVLGYTPVNKAGDTLTGSLAFPSDSGTAIKIENDFGWRDLIGDVASKSSGSNVPSQKLLFSTLRAWSYTAGDQGDLLFHVPHDYAPGTDMYIHFHWTHNGTNISGSFVINCFVTYAKGHQQQNFHSPKAITFNLTGLNITNTPSLQHCICELPLSVAGGDTSLLDTSQIEVDGLIMVSFTIATIPSISGSLTGNNNPFVLSADLHYQSTSLPTKNKAPDFYA